MKYYTAPTYESYEKLSEPFQKNGKLYVTVRLKSGKAKDVRAYTQPQEKPSSIISWSSKKTLGFESTEYITIFKGEISIDDEWFNKSICRYHKIWGWYIADGAELPTNLPSYAVPKLLYWNDISNGDSLKSEKEIQKIVNKLIF